MYNKIKIFIILIIFSFTLYINIASSQNNAQPNEYVLTLKIFDHLPRLNPNFQPVEYGQLTRNLVQKALDPIKRVPTLDYSSSNWSAIFDHGMILDPPLFDTFFINTPGINIPLLFNITLLLNPYTNTYIYDNQTFFPINYKGWDTDTTNYLYNNGTPMYEDVWGNYENFHFCMVSNMYFTYQGFEVFNFRGDDDVWVYINNKLVVDLGGLHPSAAASVDLRKLGLTVKQTYPLDFFYCERRTDTSTLRMDTNIQVFCPIFDYCGVCSGDGSTCCSCDDGNPCTADSCPKPAPGITKDNYKNYCVNTPKTCPQNDTCFNMGCSTDNGGSCVKTNSKCPDQTCKITSCSQGTGCQYKDLCTPQDMCHTVSCVSGACTPQAPINCDKGNLCMNYGCDPATGCTATPKNCANPSDPNPCNQYYCDAASGSCKMTTLSDNDCKCCKDSTPNLCQIATCNSGSGKCELTNKTITDNDLCTIDTCDVATGQISNKPMQCSGCMACKDGSCVPQDSLCSDGSKCTIDKCNANGTCDYEHISCDDQDPCTEDTCDPISGCTHTPTVCPNIGDCEVGVCTPGVGCETKPRDCATGVFCIDSVCIQGVGCANFTRNCVADDPKCQKGTCNFETQECDFKDYSPKPFGCNKAAVISTGVIVGVVVAGAVALAIAVFGGKKGYDFWKSHQNNKVASLNSNPLYTANPNGGANPLYE